MDRVPGGDMAVTWKSLGWVLGAVVAAGLMVGCRPVSAELTVNRADDGADAVPGDAVCEVTPASGDCSLRAAIEEANASPGRDRITIVPGLVPSTAGTAAPITDDLVVEGNGAVLSDRVLHTGGALELRNLTIRGVASAGTCGGAIESTGTGLDLTGVRIEENRVDGPAGARGGGVCASGPLVVRDSVVRGNVVTAPSGAAGGGIWAESSVTMASSTVSSNRVESSDGSGGGLEVVGAGPLTMGLVTVTDNEAGDATQIGAPDAAGVISASTVVGAPGGAALVLGGTLDVGGSILASAGEVCAPGGSPASLGSNLASDGSCSLSGPGDTVGDPELASLDDNGGATPTRLPGPGSPALDAIPITTAGFCDGSIATDQRGSPRPFGPGCDIGSVERQLELRVDSPADAVDADPGDGVCATIDDACTLRAAVGESNASGGGAVVVIEPGVDPVLSVAGRDEDDNATGDLDITAALVIDGAGATVDGGAIDRVLHHRSGSLVLRDLTIANGAVSAFDGGGGILARADIRIERVRFIDNQSLDVPNPMIPFVGPGSALSVIGADLVLSESTVDAGGGPAAVWVESSTMTVDASTLRGPSGALQVYASPGSISRSTLASGLSVSGSGSEVDVVASAVRGSTYALSTASGARVTVTGTVVSAATAACVGQPPASAGFNVASDRSCLFTTATDREALSAQFGPLADNGGPTPTALPLTGDPVIDAIPIGTPVLCQPGTVDQRGFSRPVGAGCDIGPVEGASTTEALGPLDLVVDEATDGLDLDPGDGLCRTSTAGCSLRAAITETNLRPTDDRITLSTAVVLDRPGAGEDAGLTGDLNVGGNLVIDGAGHSVRQTAGDRVIGSAGGSLTLLDLTVSGGSTASSGGGIGSKGDVHLERVVVRENTGSFGGGVHAARLSIADSTIVGNVATESGGGLATTTRATVTRSTISDNEAGVEAGGARLDGSVAIRDSTVSGNVITSLVGADPPAGTIAATAGVFLPSDTVAELTNVTVSGNTGGGLTSLYGSLDLRFATITDNRHFGLRSFGSDALVVGGSIIESPRGPACFSVVSVTSIGGNLAPDASCLLDGPGDQQGVGAVLMPLADNGGPTATHLPHADSPALDAVSLGSAGLCDGSAPADQRGSERPLGAACDAGAVEGNGPPLGPLSVVVDDATDGVDALVGDGACASSLGTCTLRAAVQETNLRPTDDTIVIAPGVDPMLSIGGADEELAATGDLDVYGSLRIVGNGAVIDAAGIDRGFDAFSGSLVVEDLTITGGRAVAASLAGGGALRALGATVTLDGVELSGNVAGGPGSGPGSGGALMVSQGAVVRDSVIASNQALGTGASGGGITATFPSGDLRLEATTVDGNHSDGTGGGLDGLLSLATSVTITDNHADGDGGGVRSTRATIETSSVERNTSGGSGGGIWSGTLTLTDSTVAHNSSGVDGGGIRTSAATLDLVELRDNAATRNGGGVLGEPGSLSLGITSSTISQNTAGQLGGGVHTGYLDLLSSTISANHAMVDGSSIYLPTNGFARLRYATVVGGGGGGGTELVGGTRITMAASVVSGAASCAGPVNSQGFNVVTEATCTTGANATDATVADAQLGPLADNGGPTRTHLPSVTSPAVDRVWAGLGLCNGSIPVDQRGVPRPSGPRCDSGSVER